MAFERVLMFEKALTAAAPYMAGSVEKGRARFGSLWEERLDETLGKVLPEQKAVEDAVRGYIRFALDAVKLQKIFEREKAYRAKSYAEAADEVYHNEEYMNSLYLPGILLSHYLWPHHYQQLNYFVDQFLPLVRAAEDRRFADVGVGTGFYSRQFLQAIPDAVGAGFDISASSMNYARKQVGAFGLADRWGGELRDIVADTPAEARPFLMSVEVLEHLEDPLTFLRALRRMLAPGGRGFITAAVTAPNADHIYLYNDSGEVARQLEEAGFSVCGWREDAAYEPKASEPVPRLVAFIVT